MISGLFMLFLGFFVSPLRNKILRKFGFRLKKLVSIIATIILFFIAVFTIPTGSDINYDGNSIMKYVRYIKAHDEFKLNPVEARNMPRSTAR